MRFPCAATLLVFLFSLTSPASADATPRLSTKPRTHSVQGKQDTWRSIRTNNLFVVGNAPEEDLRQVALWLEFFHSNFAQLVSRAVLDYSVPTTVVVFKDDASFLPFKPLYQGKSANVAGYFQPGEDMNYIAFSLERGGRGILTTAFHEYVHLHLRDNLPRASIWLNEGLAELYGSFSHANNEALLGAPIPFYVRLLGRGDLLPLSDFFSIDTDSPHYNEQDKTGIFYAQSWALVHYLILGDGGRRESQFRNFLSRISSGDDTVKALDGAFGMTVEALEKDFKEYIRRGQFPARRVNVGTGPQPFMAMQRSSVSDGEANFYLGDLLFHIQREAEAETYLRRAASLEPNFAPTYASLGLMYIRQKRYDEARKYLERAVRAPQSHLIHYLYAYALSREGVTAEGTISGYSPENIRVMRDELRKAIKLAPNFADAYFLLAFINLVANEQLDEAVTLIAQARRLAPAKLGYGLLLAQIHIRKRETELARQLLEPLARQTSDSAVRADAQVLLDSLNANGSQASRSKPEDTPPQIGRSTILTLDTAVSTNPATITGGLTPGSIRDGQTIENSTSLPSVDEVLNRYLEALGGAKAFKALTSRVAKGTVTIVGVSRGGSIEVHAKSPNKTLTVLQAHPIGLVKLGFDGIIGWAQTAQGVRILKGEELIALKRDSDFYNPVNLRANYPTIKLLGTSKIGYREVYVLELHPSQGFPEKLYLDSRTYLPVRVNAVRSIAGRRPVEAEIYFDDWKEVDGIKIPFNISQSMPNLTMGLAFQEIKHNVPIDDSLFEKPMR